MTAALTDTTSGTVGACVGQATTCPCVYVEGFEDETFDSDMTLEPIRAIKLDGQDMSNKALVVRFLEVGSRDDNDCLATVTVPASHVMCDGTFNPRCPLQPADRSMTLDVKVEEGRVTRCTLRASTELVRLWKRRYDKRSDLAVRQVRMLL